MTFNKFHVSGCILLLLLFTFAMMQFITLRFKAGDMYPEYSSLRSDPLGTKVLFESLKKFNTLHVSRNYERLYRLKTPDPNLTFFMIGLSTNSPAFNDKEMAKLDEIIRKGARVIVSWPWKTGRDKHYKEVSNDDLPKISKDFYTHFNITMSLFSSSKKRVMADLVPSELKDDLPPSIPWHSELTFENMEPAGWQSIYSFNVNPVMIEKKIGKGSLILLSESYLFSNEALSRKSMPSLLSYLIGPNPSIIFNETHFNIIKKKGIVTLISQYRLTGLVFGLFLLSTLFIWKNMVSLIPHSGRENDQKDQLSQTDRDHLMGLSFLYQKNIKKEDVIKLCLKEYQRTARSHHLTSTEHLNALESYIKKEDIIEKSKKDPVSSYQSIARFIAKERLK